jgi:hypothetical protein
MAKICWELDLIATWDPEEEVWLLGCKTTTKKPLDAADCQSFTPKSLVDMAQVAAEMASARMEDSS